MRADGTIVDLDGNPIGEVAGFSQIVLDKFGKISGYVGKNGEVYDKDGNIVGYVDENGNVVNSTQTILGR